MTRIVDEETGAVLLDTNNPADAQLPPLRTGHEVQEEMRQVYWRMELVARRLGERRKELDGYRLDGTLITGVAVEYQEFIEKVERRLFREHQVGKIEKWPSEATRRALAHGEMEEQEPDLKKRYNSCRTEVKNLEAYQRVLSDQMEGLRSLFAFHRQEAQAGQHVFPDHTFQPGPPSPAMPNG